MGQDLADKLGCTLGLRVVEKNIRRTGFDQLAFIHEDDPVRHLAGTYAYDTYSEEVDENEISLRDGREAVNADLEAQRDWNRFWADRYRDVPGILYDVQNEPTVGLSQHADLVRIGHGPQQAQAGSGTDIRTQPHRRVGRRDGCARSPRGSRRSPGEIVRIPSAPAQGADSPSGGELTHIELGQYDGTGITELFHHEGIIRRDGAF